MPVRTVFNIQPAGGLDSDRKLLSSFPDQDNCAPERPVNLWHDDGSGRQRWELVSTGEYNVYNIVVWNGVDGGRRFLSSDGNGNVSLAAEDDGSGRQRWVLVDVGSGFFNINVYGGTNAGETYLSCSRDGKNVDLYDKDDGTGRQRWKFTQVRKDDIVDSQALLDAIIEIQHIPNRLRNLDIGTGKRINLLDALPELTSSLVDLNPFDVEILKVGSAEWPVDIEFAHLLRDLLAHPDRLPATLATLGRTDTWNRILSKRGECIDEFCREVGVSSITDSEIEDSVQIGDFGYSPNGGWFVAYGHSDRPCYLTNNLSVETEGLLQNLRLSKFQNDQWGVLSLGPDGKQFIYSDQARDDPRWRTYQGLDWEAPDHPATAAYGHSRGWCAFAIDGQTCVYSDIPDSLSARIQKLGRENRRVFRLSLGPGDAWILHTCQQTERAVEENKAVSVVTDLDYGETYADAGQNGIAQDVVDLVHYIENRGLGPIVRSTFAPSGVAVLLTESGKVYSTPLRLCQTSTMLTKPLDNAGEYSYRAILKLRPEDKWADITCQSSVTIRTDQGPKANQGTSPEYTVDKKKWVKVTPNPMGVVVLNLFADTTNRDGMGLSAPTLQVNLSSMQEDTWFDIYPDQGLHTHIANLPEEALWKVQGKVPDKLLEHVPLEKKAEAAKEVCNHVQRAVQNLAKSATYTSATPFGFPKRRMTSEAMDDSQFVVHKRLCKPEYKALPPHKSPDEWVSRKTKVQGTPSMAQGFLNDLDHAFRDVEHVVVHSFHLVGHFAEGVTQLAERTIVKVGDEAVSIANEEFHDAESTVKSVATDVSHGNIEAAFEAAAEGGFKMYKDYQTGIYHLVHDLAEAAIELVAITVRSVGREVMFVLDNSGVLGNALHHLLSLVGMGLDDALKWLRKLLDPLDEKITWLADGIGTTLDGVEGCLDTVEQKISSLGTEMRGWGSQAEQSVLQQIGSQPTGSGAPLDNDTTNHIHAVLAKIVQVADDSLAGGTTQSSLGNSSPEDVLDGVLDVLWHPNPSVHDLELALATTIVDSIDGIVNLIETICEDVMNEVKTTLPKIKSDVSNSMENPIIDALFEVITLGKKPSTTDIACLPVAIVLEALFSDLDTSQPWAGSVALSVDKKAVGALYVCNQVVQGFVEPATLVKAVGPYDDSSDFFKTVNLLQATITMSLSFAGGAGRMNDAEKGDPNRSTIEALRVAEAASTVFAWCARVVGCKAPPNKEIPMTLAAIAVVQFFLLTRDFQLTKTAHPWSDWQIGSALTGLIPDLAKVGIPYKKDPYVLAAIAFFMLAGHESSAGLRWKAMD